MTAADQITDLVKKIIKAAGTLMNLHVIFFFILEELDRWYQDLDPNHPAEFERQLDEIRVKITNRLAKHRW